jgi:hypothetical protein
MNFRAAGRIGEGTGTGAGPLPPIPYPPSRFRRPPEGEGRTVEPAVLALLEEGGQSRALFFAPPQNVIVPTDPLLIRVSAPSSRGLLLCLEEKDKKKKKLKPHKNKPHQAKRVRDNAQQNYKLDNMHFLANKERD